ncbi:MAG: DUF342 domain-containing protein [Clostridiaceae bacterium]|nr:DUF342 domain-containing protein [Clostridiaceae bacterium]
MITKIFKDSSLEKCIELACRELNLTSQELQYNIIENKKGLFKRVVSISVDFIEKSEEIKTEDSLIEGLGTIKISDGKFIIKDPEEGREAAVIAPSRNVKIMVDGILITSKKQLFKNNVIELIYEENTACRNLNIQISPEKTEAYINIIYIPKVILGIKDTIESHFLLVEAEIMEKIYPPIYNKDEISEELRKQKINYGIIKENFEKCTTENGVEKLLIAKGISSINDEDDVLEVKISSGLDSKHLLTDEKGNVDFKSIGFISAVEPGDILAIIHKGKDGKDGIDIFGKEKKHKKGLRAKLNAGNGCEIKEENSIVATIEGKPCVKGNTFFVYRVHEVQGDVDIKSGDIKFIGDVLVSGNVKEGMKIEAGNIVQVQKNVERATITAIGNVVINGSAIYSTISAGGHDVKNLKQIENMSNLKSQLISLMETVEQIKKFNLLGNNVLDGEAIKVLIENKFKQIPKISLDIIVCRDLARGEPEEKIIGLIKGKLLGLGPLSIKNYWEIDEILKLIDENVEGLNYSLSLPVSIRLPYCQECTISSSGDITFTGNGEYVSNITANGNIYFENSQSVARGGELKAKKEIRCKKIGSTGGVSTKLSVEKDGHIWAELAYQNTQFIIGSRKYDLDYPSKGIHVYLDEKGDIVTESLKL